MYFLIKAFSHITFQICLPQKLDNGKTFLSSMRFFRTLALYPCSNMTILLWFSSMGVQCFSYPQ